MAVVGGKIDPLLGRPKLPAFGMQSYDADAQAYFAAMATPEPLWVQQAVTGFVVGLKADGSWPVVDRIILPMGSEQAALLDLRQPAKTALNQNGAIFTAYRGFAGDGVSAYLSFGEVMDAAGNSFSLNAAFVFGYTNQQSAAAGAGVSIGTTSASSTRIRPNATGNSQNSSLNSSNISQPAPTGRLGNFMIVRPSAPTTRFYVNGVNVSGDAAQPATLTSAGNACLLRTSSAYIDDRVACGGYGGALSEGQALSFQNRLQALMTALGANY